MFWQVAHAVLAHAGFAEPQQQQSSLPQHWPVYSCGTICIHASVQQAHHWHALFLCVDSLPVMLHVLCRQQLQQAFCALLSLALFVHGLLFLCAEGAIIDLSCMCCAPVQLYALCGFFWVYTNSWIVSWCSSSCREMLVSIPVGGSATAHQDIVCRRHCIALASSGVYLSER